MLNTSEAESWISDHSGKREVQFSKKSEGSGEPENSVTLFKNLNSSETLQLRIARFNAVFPPQRIQSYPEVYKDNNKSPSQPPRVRTDGDKVQIPKTQTEGGLGSIREGQERIYQERPRIIRTTAEKGIETEPPQIPLPSFNVELREQEPRIFWDCCKRRREQSNQVRAFGAM